MADLELVGTEDLIREIMKRYDGVLLVLEKDDHPAFATCTFNFKGGLSRALGLCERAKDRIMTIANNCIPKEDDEPGT